MDKKNLLKLNSYLSFKLGEEVFAANAGKVLNILELSRITEVPMAPAYMKGIINLRGTILPVVDLRLKFGMSPTVETANTCIVVLDISIDDSSVLVGGLVDTVQAVIELDKAEILPPPSIGSKYRSEFIEGVAYIDESFVMVLDLDAIFSSDEISALSEKTFENSDQATEIGT